MVIYVDVQNVGGFVVLTVEKDDGSKEKIQLAASVARALLDDLHQTLDVS